MADETAKTPPIPFEVPRISIDASVHAPLLYFDEASAFGFFNGVFRVTLEAAKMYPNHPDDGITIERVAVAHLRMNVQGAISLKNAIESALLIASPASSEARN
jgi:hypothetical protein